MITHGRRPQVLTAVVLGIGLIGPVVLANVLNRSINGTIWAANRGAHTIRGFDARARP